MIKWYTEYTDTFIFPICPLNAPTLHSQKGFGAPVYIYTLAEATWAWDSQSGWEGVFDHQVGEVLSDSKSGKTSSHQIPVSVGFFLCADFRCSWFGLEERNVYLFENLINPRYFVWYRFLAPNNSQKLKKTLLPPVPEVISLRMKRTGKRETSR